MTTILPHHLLADILGLLDDLDSDEQLSASNHRKVELIRENARHLQDLINETLEFKYSELSSLDCDFIDHLNTIVKEHIMQEDIDMAFLTQKMAMSHSTFYRKVKALTGMTANDYVRHLKLSHCYKLLESGNYNVGEAAMMTGFNQMSHFREVFKKEFGILPSEVTKKR